MKEITLHSIGILLIFFAYVRAEEILPGEYMTGYISPGESHSYAFYAGTGDVVTILMSDLNEILILWGFVCRSGSVKCIWEIPV
ncbi:MAG: hypothetical protein CEE41_04825 [Hadesarchaea archaeon B3_Hades]|nr:MAG: hypothetical protein CEE41_04825 [Hadesarchaea archaeon B3_Hades]